MAEIAFGVVGVAGLAIQLADSLKKLQAFAALVKDAPSELRELIEYIDISRQWLDSISTTSVAAMDPALTLRCEGPCRRAVDRLAVVARELEQGMQTKKRRTALKLAWTTDALERLRKRLESSKVDLHNAHSMFVAEQIRTELSTEGRRIRDTMVDLNSEAHAQHQDLNQVVGKVQSGQTVMEHIITTGQHDIQQNFIHLGRELQMSHRTQQQGFLSVQTGQKNLQHSLNTAHARSQQHMRMQTSLITGHFDTGQVQTMSRIKQVLDALSVLSAAVTYSSLGASQAVQLLNQQVLATIQLVWAADRTQVSTSRAGALVRKLLCTPSFNANISEEMMGALAKQPSIWTTEERLKLLYWIGNARTSFDHNAIIIDILIGLDLTSPVAAAMQEPDGFTVLHALAIGLCESHLRRRDDLSRLKELLRIYVQSGAYRLGRQDWGMTPLATLLDQCVFPEFPRYPRDLAVASTGVVQSWAQESTEVLQSWAQSLHLAGVDLQSYGRAEMNTLRLCRERRWGSHIFLVEYGPEVANWAVLDMQAGHSYAGLFWHVIEHPEENIPGAWCDNDDSAVACEDILVDMMHYDKDYRKLVGYQAYYQRQGRNHELLRRIRIECHLDTN
ncbi:hypothetical protein LTR17_024601 [Elasticomyces elasticus]|nr:hypothetical protein LTR17_024601 [Elasticomyces elasticus]